MHYQTRMTIDSQFSMNANNSKKKNYSCEKRKVYRYFSPLFLFSRILLRILFLLLLFLEFARNVKQLIKHDDILKHLISDNWQPSLESSIAIEYSCLFFRKIVRRFVNREDSQRNMIEWQNGRMAERQNEDKIKQKHQIQIIQNALGTRN